MKLNKIYTAVIKEFLKRAKGKYTKLALGRLEDGQIFITTDGLVGWVIPEELFPFETSKLADSEIDAGRILGADKYYRDAWLTSELREIPMDKAGRKMGTVVKVTDGEASLWVDRRLLDTFEEPAVMIKAELDPIRIYEGEELAGVVLPVRI